MFRGKNREYSEDQKILMNTTDIESFYVLKHWWIESEPEVSDVNTPLSDIEDEVDESDKSTGFQVDHYGSVWISSLQTLWSQLQALPLWYFHSQYGR